LAQITDSPTSISRDSSNAARRVWSKKVAGVHCRHLVILAYHILRFTGMQPVVMSDEQRFNTFSRILDPAQADVPSYLFYFIYRPTNQCGSGFPECGRMMNLALLGLGSVLLHALGNLLLPRKTSAFIA
jgi:phosphoglycerol transferase